MNQPLRLLLLFSFVTLSYCSIAQKWEKVYLDTNIFSIDTVTVGKNKFIGFINDKTYFLLNGKGDTLIKKTDYYFGAEFKDFNQDGHKDILLHYSSNATMVLDLFVYMPTIKSFKEVKGFRQFPAPLPIKNTGYYYSYHKSGCADMNWDSDLFYIKDFKAITLGNISGRQCDNRDGVKDAVYIHKVHGKQKQLFKTLPIMTIWKYKDYKWGFIEEYWTNNYRQFL